MILGQGGKDLIRHDIYRGATGFVADNGNLTVFGDWAYGTEDAPNDATKQYGDTRLEKKLHGDDD